jgi:hypothetical protein
MNYHREILLREMAEPQPLGVICVCNDACYPPTVTIHKTYCNTTKHEEPAPRPLRALASVNHTEAGTPFDHCYATKCMSTSTE